MSQPQGIERRDFLRAAVGGAAVMAGWRTAAGYAVATPKAAKDRPNILVIMSDEHNARVAGCYGSRIVQTPHLDSIAAKGVTFENCYCNSPLCVPSRLAFTAGKYISRIGGWNNSCRLASDDYPSIPHVMNAAGYQSFLCGKQHYDRSHRYGFTEIGGNMNQNVMNGRGGRRQPDDLPGGGQLSARFREFAAADESSIMSHDRKVTAGVVDFLQKRRRSEGPFFLFAGYLAPHFPLIVPQAYWDRYRDRVPMPVIPPGFLDLLPLNYKHLRAGFQMENVPPELVKKGRELYHGLTQWFDDQVGVVLKTLADSEAARNTVIIYTADHGENMGEHGLWWKNAVYDNAARVPLLVSWPERWAGGQRRAGACSMVDLVRTIAEIGGGESPDDWDGDSLCGWLDDPKTKWKDLAVSQYYAHNIASGYNMIRQGDYKYVYHTRMDATHGPSCELYDLKADPDEMKNLASDPSQKPRIAALHAALVKELADDPDEIELRCRADYAKGYAGVTGGGKKGAGKKGGGKKGRGKGGKKARQAAG